LNWKLKVAGHKLLSVIPGGITFYKILQERVTHSLVPGRERVAQKIDIGLQYFDWLERRGRTDELISGTHVDFGSGWSPTIPLLFYAFGCERQYLFDILPRPNREIVVQTIDVFRKIVTEPAWPHRTRLKRLPETPPDDGRSWQEILGGFGLNYAAPYWPMLENLRGAADVVTCTQVLPLVSREAMRAGFQFLSDILKTGGLFLAVVHLKDIYALGDPSISHYNHLKFSPWLWDRVVSSEMMAFNRLKASDYRELLEEAGFRILDFDVEGPTADDLRVLDTIRIHPCFAKYSREELGAKHLFFAAEKP
jgi:methyltransferase family protein